tara:strand:- start:6320 stop:8011 length:1692 start_codon:yes stop_codon:yes gene_type:complete
MLIIFFITTFLILLSTIGYGLVFTKVLKFERFNYNIGLIGIFGLYLLSILSSYSHIITPHNYIHNLIVILIGLLSYFIFSKKNFKDFKYLIFVFSILFIAIILAKNNEDFSYYHLPNSLQFAQQKLQFGLGNLNHGFKHISSLFMLMSLNYLPIFEFYLFNTTNLMFLVFMIFFLLKEIFERFKINLNLSQILLSFFIILLLTKFSRLAEYGSDIASQIIIAIYFFYVIEMTFNKKLNSIQKSFYSKISLILLVFAITTKFIYIIYALILVPFLISNQKNRSLFYNFFEIKYLFLIFLPLVFLIFFNFASTGCLIYPVAKLCLSSQFDWALSSEVVNYLNSYYELWSKAGAGVNFQVENQTDYLIYLNWLPNWFSLYFFNKVSDYLLVILFIMIVFSFFFRKEINKTAFKSKKFKKFIFFYTILIFTFLVWFLNFPTLRYAGYIILLLIIVFPFSIFLNNKISLSKKKNLNKISLIITICFSIFLLKNIIRINNELNLTEKDHNNFKDFPLFWINKKEFKELEINDHKLYFVSGSCWSTPSTCIKSKDIKIHKKNNYIFYSIK